MTKTQIIWNLRKKTITIAGKIIEAAHKVRRKEEKEDNEETRTRIVEQNTALHEILKSIQGGDIPTELPEHITAGQVLEMAKELQEQIEFHNRRPPSEEEIRASFIIAITTQSEMAYDKIRFEAKQTIGTEAEDWIRTAAFNAKIYQ